MSYKPSQDNQLSAETHDDIFTKQHKSLSASISPALPSFLLSSSDDHPNPQPQALPNVKKQRGNESRNLLLHVLNQLQRRSKPPTVSETASKNLSDAAESGFGVLLDTVRDAMKVRNSKQDTQPGGMAQDDSDDESQDIYSTDNSYDLMLQLKDVLSMSFTQGWRIFEDSAPEKEWAGESWSPPRLRSRHSFNQQSGNRRQSPQEETPTLLSTCIAIISSVVLEDCRYKISLPRPSRPPYALQALVINISQFLLHSHLHDPTVISQIGFAMVPAFATFQPEMHNRVLQFFIDLLQVALSCLARLQGWVDVSKNETSPPMVSIQVEDPDAMCIDNQDWHTNGLSSFSSQRLLSTTAPQQSLAIYQLGTLAPSLLAAILESVDVDFSIYSHETTHYFLRMFELLVLLKGDAYSDLLQIAASQPSKVRRLALGLISMKWPKAMGHLVITEPIFLTETSQITASSMETVHAHQFAPWYFHDCSNGFTVNGPDQAGCQCCTTPIHGFGLLCPFCMCQVHFDCYDDPEGSSLVQYALTTDPHVQRVAMYRFSTIRQGTEVLDHREHEKHGHLFHSVNLFTLCLCFICRKPLWGCSNQGLKCTTCPAMIHFACLSSVSTRCRAMRIDSSHITIDSLSLQQSCLEYYRDILLITKEALNDHTYEEVSILDATLSTQLQLLTNGVALGSIIVLQQNNPTQFKDYTVEEFELHQLIRWCHVYLISQKRPVSLATEEYMQENKLSRAQHSVMFDWSYLLFMTSTLKAPDPTHVHIQKASRNLLNVTEFEIDVDDQDNCSIHPYTAVSVPFVRGVLGQQFNVHSDRATRLVLAHLNHLGFLERHDSSDRGDLIDHCAVYVFPLPLGLDLSSDVESLVGTVEACLTDLDLSVNEYGLLLLIRKLWPNGLASDYGLRRLSRALLGWILVEDNNLAIIFRDYLTKQRGLPGVRSTPIRSWPSTKTPRPGPNNSVNNGGDYVAARRSLLSAYVIRWLNALHDRDTLMYVDLVWDTCLDMAEIDDVILQHTQLFVEEEDKEQYVGQCDSVLRSIVRLSQASVIFNIFDSLFVRWMELLVTLNLHDKPMTSLSRLFPRETEASQRSSVINIEFAAMSGLSSHTDPWQPIMNIAKESKESFARALPWLCILARSGVEISSATFRWFATSILRSHVDLRDTLIFVKALFASVWLRSLGRQDLQEVFSLLHSQLSAEVVHSLKEKSNPVDALTIIRFSLASCLLIYGCIRDNIVELDLISEQEIRDLPSRRRINFRGSYTPDPVVIAPGILQALELYVDVGDEEVTCLIAKFLNQFMADSPFLESYEVDNFILRNGKLLSTCAWKFYNIQHHELSSIRVNFLLRILCVDPEPFQGLLHSLFSTPNTQQRLLALNVIFQVVLDVTSPSFVVEGRQWRSSVTEIFFHFFGAIWSDDSEEIRSAASTFSATLLPAHFEVMSLCWAESLTKAPIAERLKLACFLVQLRPHFPTWKVLSWDVILESLIDYDDQHSQTVGVSHSNQDGNNGAPQVTTLDEDSDIARLRVAIILLSLRMVADGIPIDAFTLMKIKVQVIQMVGFKQVTFLSSPNSRLFRVQFGELPEIEEVAIPCIEALTSVLDSHHILDLPGSVLGPAYDEDRTSRFLVGAVFIDVSLAILSTTRELISLPVLTLKSILEGLYIIIHKYDLEHEAFIHLQPSLRRAVLRSLEFINQDISFEIRQLALSVTQAFLRSCHTFMGPVIYSALEQLAQLISSHGQHDQDVLVVQARLCLEFTLESYCSSGLFIGLFKRNLDKSFFVVLDQLIGPETSSKGTFKSENLRDALLRDTLARFVDCDHSSLQTVLNNLLSFIQVVHHRGYSADLILVTGQQLTHLVRRMSDATGDLTDPTPLFVIPTLLILHNKSYSKELLPYVDTVLRVALNRLEINIACLAELIDVASNLTRKYHLNTTDVISLPNSIVVVVFEILSDALKMKTRVQPSTLKAMLEVVFAPSSGFFPPSSANHKALLDLMDNTIYFLRHHSWQDAKIEDDFVASLAIAKTILRVADFNVLAFHKFLEQGQEKNHRLSMDLRSWNIVVMAALLEPVYKWETMLLSNLPVFSSIYCGVLRSLGQSDAMADINHIFIALKLWVMLTRKASTEKIETMPITVWNELWSPFQAFVDGLELDGQTSSFTILAISSAVDLLGFLRTVRSPIALKVSTHASTLKRLQLSNHGESASAKLNRALKSISEPPPSFQMDALLDQIAKEIIATEKLRLLEAKREVGKNVSDKKGMPERRRDGRIPT